MNAPVEGLTALRHIDPAEAELGHALSTLLRHKGMRAQLVGAGTARGQTPWFPASDGTAFHVAAVAGCPVPLSAARIGDTVAALDSIDPLLVAVEGAWGLSMDSVAMVDALPADMVFVSAALDADEVLLGVALDHPRRSEWIAGAARLPPWNAQMPCVVRIEADGPRLSVGEATTLSSGDLLLIPNRTAALLRVGDRTPTDGMIDLTTGVFSAGETGAAMPDDAPDFLVPLTIHLPDRMTSAASLSVLVPGSTLALGPIIEGMQVELRVARRLLATGELVQLGDRFAVLVEVVADIADAPAGEDSQ
jgi:Type III flagellar switch regulator (C-ring) FliN C-term